MLRLPKTKGTLLPYTSEPVQGTFFTDNAIPLLTPLFTSKARPSAHGILGEEEGGRGRKQSAFRCPLGLNLLRQDC